mgnify:CR=1 FL=1
MALLLDARARDVEQVHVVDAARAGGHAGQAGQAAHCRIWLLFRSRAGASAGRRRVSSLRSGPPPRFVLDLNW